VAENLSRLERAGSTGRSSESMDHAVAKELSSIISTRHPELSSYLNYLGDAVTKSYLRQFTTSLAKSVRNENPDALNNLDLLQAQVTTKLDEYLLNESELREKLYHTLPLINEKERLQLTNSILKELARSSLGSNNLYDILDNVSASLKIGESEKLAIQKSLANSGLDISLEYRQNELHNLLVSRHLTRGEINLVKKGINPFLVTNSIDTTVEKEKGLLAKYNSQSIYQNKQFVTLREAYENELSKSNPDPLFLAKARSHLNRVSYYASLTPIEKRQVNRTRFGRFITNARSRAYELQSQFFDKWVDIEETITGKKWLNKQLDRWDKFAENYTIKFGRVNVPIFRLKNWIFNGLDKWKQVTTHKFLAEYATKTSWLGKFTFNRLRDYELGGFTLKGATFVATHRAWSAIAYKASAGIIKDGTVFAVRTATRLLIKLGGKTLAKAGADAILAIASLAGGITTILGIAAVVDFVASLGKFAWEFIQKFVPNKEAFVATVATIWAGVAGFFATFTIGGLVWPVIIPLALVLSIGLGSLGFMTVIYKTVNITTHLDVGSALQQIAVDLLCDEDSAGTEVGVETETAEIKSTGNSVASCANCLAKYLNECYGGSVNSSNISRGLSCLAAKAISPESISIIERSASGFTYLQCVGFVQAAIACAGGSLQGANACSYAGDVAPGWKFIRGTVGARPGDPIVFSSSGTCSDGAPGHIGIMTSDGGALVCLSDANQVCNGCVAQNNCLPKTNMAGFLKKL